MLVYETVFCGRAGDAVDERLLIYDSRKSPVEVTENLRPAHVLDVLACYVTAENFLKVRAGMAIPKAVVDAVAYNLD
jgi:hypothetical protein